MELAKKQLMAMGWKEGQGLGKNEDGIKSALRPRIKQDVCGLGFDQSNEVSTQVWFAQIDDVIMAAKSKKKTNEEAKEKFYKNFVKVEKEGAEDSNGNEDAVDNDDDAIDKKSSKKRKRKNGFSLDEVYELSGGRTCHKGARHGIKMNAKLERLREQEEQFLKSLRNKS